MPRNPGLIYNGVLANKAHLTLDRNCLEPHQPIRSIYRQVYELFAGRKLQYTVVEKSIIYFKVQPKVVSVRNAQGILFLPQVLAVRISVQLKNAFRFTNVQTAQKVYTVLTECSYIQPFLLLRFLHS